MQVSGGAHEHGSLLPRCPASEDLLQGEQQIQPPPGVPCLCIGSFTYMALVKQQCAWFAAGRQLADIKVDGQQTERLMDTVQLRLKVHLKLGLSWLWSSSSSQRRAQRQPVMAQVRQELQFIVGGHPTDCPPTQHVMPAIV